MATILILILQQFTLKALGSFHALGPPAAPVLHNVGSANGFNKPEFNSRFLEFHSRFSLSGNPSVDDIALRITNNTIDSMDTGYFWLTDPTYQHKVEKVT